MLTKICMMQAMIFPVVMYGCESWTINQAEHQRMDAFELWCWRRFSSILWTGRRSNQSILKEINSEYSLEGLMFKLKLQYFGHLIRRTDSLEKILRLGKMKCLLCPTSLHWYKFEVWGFFLKREIYSNYKQHYLQQLRHGSR